MLPDSEQLVAEREGRGWPSKETLLACGAEYLPSVPQDGLDELRAQTESGARVVRIDGCVFSEGDIVSNTAHRLGTVPES